MTPVDNIRPRGTVEVACSCGCGWCFWLDAMDPRLPNGPFYRPGCGGTPPMPALKESKDGKTLIPVDMEEP